MTACRRGERVTYHCVGDGWRHAATWPPAHTVARWTATSHGNANSRHGDGVLVAGSSDPGPGDVLVVEPLVPYPGEAGRLPGRGGVRGPARRALLHLGAADGGARDRREPGGDRDRLVRSPRTRRGRHAGARHRRARRSRRQRWGDAMLRLRSGGGVGARRHAAADRAGAARRGAACASTCRAPAGRRSTAIRIRSGARLPPRRRTRSSRRSRCGASPSICRSSPSSIGSRGGAHGARGFPVRLRRDG